MYIYYKFRGVPLNVYFPVTSLPLPTPLLGPLLSIEPPARQHLCYLFSASGINMYILVPLKCKIMIMRHLCLCNA